jgi:hypothetical protein
MKVTATKWEDVEVEVSDEQIENLMCSLLKSDYEQQLEILEVEFPELIEAMKVVYEAYSGKPIDFVERLSH